MNSKARHIQTDNSQLYFAEPYTKKDKVASAMNNAEPLCAGVCRLVNQLFSTILLSRHVHMRSTQLMQNRPCKGKKDHMKISWQGPVNQGHIKETNGMKPQKVSGTFPIN